MIHLADENGKEMALRLQNWDLAARESHKLTAIWLVKKGKSKGPYVAIHNHTLDSTDYDERTLAKMYRTLWILLVSIAVLFFPVLGWGLKFILMVAGIGYWWYQGVSGRRELIASGKLLQLAGV
jgi:hypothetical protein